MKFKDFKESKDFHRKSLEDEIAMVWNQFFAYSLADGGNFWILMRIIRLLATGSRPVWTWEAIAVAEAVGPLTIFPRPRGYEKGTVKDKDMLFFKVQISGIV